MREPSSSGVPGRKAAPTHKERGVVQRSVMALLDELAPEKTLSRSERAPGVLEQHRSPNGCVLQGPDYAVSVSWFADESKLSSLGELHIIVWRGRVARRGATRHTKGATIASELALIPIEPPENGNVWHSTDGSDYSTDSLASKCLALLQEQAGIP